MMAKIENFLSISGTCSKPSAQVPKSGLSGLAANLSLHLLLPLRARHSTARTPPAKSYETTTFQAPYSAQNYSQDMNDSRQSLPPIQLWTRDPHTLQQTKKLLKPQPKVPSDLIIILLDKKVHTIRTFILMEVETFQIKYLGSKRKWQKKEEHINKIRKQAQITHWS